MEPFPIKLEPQSPQKFDDNVNYDNYLKLDDVNGKLLDNLKSEYTNGINSIIKEEYDIPDDNHMIDEDSNNSDRENQENHSFNIESRNVHWPSKKHEQINSVQPHKSTFDVSNDVASNNSNLLNDKVVDADTMNDKENQSFGKPLIALNFRRYCLHCKLETREVLRFRGRNDCVKCKKRMVFQCLKCNKQYDNLKGMRYHIQICGNPEKRFKCAQCDYRTSVLQLLQQHRRRVHVNSEKIIECSNCNKRFKNIESCQRHEQTCGKDRTLTCTHCPYKTHRKSVLNYHLKCHEKIYQKLVQNNEASALDFLNDNRKQELYSGISKIQASYQRYCSKCKENFENKFIYNSNKCKNCKTKLLMRCIKCDSLHKSRQAFAYHLQKHQCILKTKFECSMCDYITTNKKNLKFHKVKHEKIRDSEQFYKCPKCPSLFKIKKYLVQHIRTNCMSNKPHLLCDHCPFRTLRKNALISHLKSHMAIENIVRQVCRKKKSTNEKSRSLLLLGYCSKCDVSRKVAKRSAVCLTCKLPLVFPECINVKTSSQQALHLHEKKEHQYFECEDCGKAFERLSNLDCHKKVCKPRISA